MSFAGAEVSWNRQSPRSVIWFLLRRHSAAYHQSRTSENGDMISAKIHASQGFDWRRLKIGASGYIFLLRQSAARSGRVLRYSGNSIGVNADISLTPFKWLGVSYQGNYSQSAIQQKGYDIFPWLRTVTNKASLDFTIPGGVTLTTSLYHYYNNFNDGDKSFLLLNAEAKYTIKRFSFTLSCDNLLNRKSYVYSSLSALTESKAIYNIRPRSVFTQNPIQNISKIHRYEISFVTTFCFPVYNRCRTGDMLTNYRPATPVDTARYKVTYSLKYKFHPDQKDANNDTRIVQIGKRNVKDYSDIINHFDSLATEQIRRGADSYSNVAGNPWSLEIIIPIRGEKADLKYRLSMSAFFVYSDSVPTLEWSFSDETTDSIMGYDCRKATVEFADEIIRHGLRLKFPCLSVLTNSEVCRGLS